VINNELHEIEKRIAAVGGAGVGVSERESGRFVSGGRGEL
jgi:hypothetical protein